MMNNVSDTVYEKHSGLDHYDGKMIRIVDRWEQSFTGTAIHFNRDYMFHEYGWDEEGILINGCIVRAGDIIDIEERPGLSILRADQLWQRAGAYYVRIQAMAKKHHITLRQEFDEHDGSETRYIVVTDQDFPIATARMYPLDQKRMMIGRVVVLPEYRHQGIGTMVVSECEVWAEDLHYEKTVVDSRENKVAFYEQMGYEVCDEAVKGETFRCIRMEKDL